MRNNKFVHSNNPAIVYYDGEGSIWGDSKAFVKDQGKGFGQGDTVKICVSASGLVQWIVNGEKQASYLMSKLKKKESKWVFFVAMYNNGDEIEWFE